MKKSNLDVAFELVSKKKNPVEFKKLWDEVSQIQGMGEEEAKGKSGKFYTQLSLDGRFIVLKDNTWDLRSRYTFDKVHIDISEVYTDESEEDEIETEVDENASEKDLFGDEEDREKDEDGSVDVESSDY